MRLARYQYIFDALKPGFHINDRNDRNDRSHNDRNDRKSGFHIFIFREVQYRVKMHARKIVLFQLSFEQHVQTMT